MSYGSNTFRYGSDGLRVQKNNTYYYWENGRIIIEKRPDCTIYYGYDATGIATMNIVGGPNAGDYYFIKNIMGDVIHIYDGQSPSVASYKYDAWGNVTIVSQTNGIGTFNPFRYRGYYYDTETSKYYLQSRYYDPETGRFINADDGRILGIGMGVIGGTNLFSYCLNNPVGETDPSGEIVLSLIVGIIVTTVIGAAIGGTSAAVTAMATGQDVQSAFIGGAIAGGIGALFTSFAIATGGIGGLALAGIGGFIAGGLGNYVNQGFSNNNWTLDSMNKEELLLSAIMCSMFNMVTFGIMTGYINSCVGIGLTNSLINNLNLVLSPSLTSCITSGVIGAGCGAIEIIASVLYHYYYQYN